MDRVLPPDIDEQTLDAALDIFSGVVGKDWVYSGRAMRGYRDAYAVVDDDHFKPSAAVAPSNVEEVQMCLRIANEYKIPLWPISTGKNLAYGGAAPRLPGAVTLDLKRMNKILEVNEEFGYALVEPGVSYFDLYEYLQKNDIKLWLDPPSPGWGSVLGNTVERGVGYTPYGDHLTMQCGMEVVLPNGEVVRTGMGALPNNNTWQLFKYGFGPYLDGIFTQSSLGVVTKLGIWLMPEPPGFLPFMIAFPREEDLEKVVEILRPLKISMVIPNAAVVSHVLLEAANQTTRAQYYTGKGPLPASAIKKIMVDQDLGYWNFYAGLYGPEPINNATWEMIQDAFSAVPGARFYLAEDRPGDQTMDYRIKGMNGTPNLQEFAFVNWIGGGGHVDFAPISATTGAEAMKQYAMVRDRSFEYGFDYVGEFIVGWREMHHVYTLIFDRTRSDTKKQAYDLFETLVADAAANGYGEYRTHLAFMDQIAATYDWNDNALMRLHERMKDALDPNGILSPGKQGVWPERFRGKGY